jgi:protoheme IX farnesyltransferase
MEATQAGDVLLPIHGTWRDYLNLAKPLTTLMLQVPALAALMIAAGQEGPSLKMMLVTIIGGVLTCAGANALNCYIDHERDSLMYQTRNRPIPAQRIDPSNARRFGLLLSVLGVATFAFGATLVSALLAFTGILFYVIVYTSWLKMRTTYNSLFSGIAWAWPALVGWSVSGGFSFQALVLFGILIYWAPVMYMARGIAYKKDYTRAGVPLLPVVHGDRPARAQVMVYSTLMVLMSFVPVALGMLYSFYGVAALSLGGLFLMIAVFVFKNPGIKPAIFLTRYTQLYLVGLFAAMVLDRIVFISQW